MAHRAKRKNVNVRINVSQEQEVRYWALKFGVAREKLREAVDRVGPIVGSVEHYLAT